MWSKNTPGALTKVIDGTEQGATEVIMAKQRYSMRFIGGNYDESWLGTSFEAFFGTRSKHASSGEPEGAQEEGEDNPLTNYREEIHADWINEVFHSTWTHTETTTGTRLVERRTMDWMLDCKDEAQIIKRENVATLQIEETDRIGSSVSRRELIPTMVTEKISAGASSVEQRVTPGSIDETYTGPSYFQSFNMGEYVQGFNGGKYGDFCFAGLRLDFYAGLVRTVFSGFGAHVQVETSALRADVIYSPLWAESHAGAVKVEAHTGLILDQSSAKVVSSLTDIRQALMTVFC